MQLIFDLYILGILAAVFGIPLAVIWHGDR
jgi:hypothetical protein